MNNCCKPPKIKEPNSNNFIPNSSFVNSLVVIDDIKRSYQEGTQLWEGIYAGTLGVSGLTQSTLTGEINFTGGNVYSRIPKLIGVNDSDWSVSTDDLSIFGLSVFSDDTSFTFNMSAMASPTRTWKAEQGPAPTRHDIGSPSSPVIGNERNVGEWTAGITTFNALNEYSTYLGVRYKVIVGTPLPYIAQGSDPLILPDSEFVESYVSDETSYKPNLLQNHNFITQAPGVIVDATPQDFIEGEEIFSGWFAGVGGITDVTYINGEVSKSTGTYYQDIPKSGALGFISNFTASIKSTTGPVTETGVSFSLVGNNYRIVVDASSVFSVCFNDGDFAASHAVEYGVISQGSTTPRTLGDRFSDKVNVTDYGAIADGDKITHTGTDNTEAFKRAVNAARLKRTTIYVPPAPEGKGFLLDSDTIFFGPLNQASIDTFPPNNVCLGIVGDNDESTVIICGDGLAGKVVFDYTGLGHKIADGFTLWRNIESNAPSVGILTARFKNGLGVTGNYGGYFGDVTMFKYFTIAGRLAITTEETREERLNIRNDHYDSYGTFISTSDGSSESYPNGPSWNDLIGEVVDSTLVREDKAGSNLHQTHVKCDYYYGNNTPNPLKDPCMLRLDGPNGVSIEDPFFNNNTARVDCVQIRKAGNVGVPFGISVTNPLYHQETKSGVRVMTGMNRLDLSQSNTLPGFGFVESELVVDGFLSGATIEAVDSIDINATLDSSTISYVSGKVSQAAQVINCECEAVNAWSQTNSQPIISTKISCKTWDWNTDASNYNSEVTVRETVNALANRAGIPRFTLRYKGASLNIEGQIPSSWLGTPASIPNDSVEYTTSNTRNLSYLLSRAVNKDIQVLEQDNQGFSKSFQRFEMTSNSAQDYNFREINQGGVRVITEKKGGISIYELSTGGIVLTKPDGTQARLVLDNSNVASWVPYV